MITSNENCVISNLCCNSNSSLVKPFMLLELGWVIVSHILPCYIAVSMPVSLICHVGKSGPWMMFILSTPICCSLNALSDAYPRVVRCVETVAISLRHQFVESAEKLREVNEMFTHWALRTVVSVLRLEYFENSIKNNCIDSHPMIMGLTSSWAKFISCLTHTRPRDMARSRTPFWIFSFAAWKWVNMDGNWRNFDGNISSYV